MITQVLRNLLLHTNAFSREAEHTRGELVMTQCLTYRFIHAEFRFAAKNCFLMGGMWGAVCVTATGEADSYSHAAVMSAPKCNPGDGWLFDNK